MTTTRNEHAGVLLGVPGRFHNVIMWPEGEDRWAGHIANQKFVSQRRKTNRNTTLQVEIRFDDNCKNGHESFTITATEYEGGRDIAGGCMHDEITEAFPEFDPLIKWHLCSTDGPMHYVANTVFHAGNRDHWGLEKGQVSYSQKSMLHAQDAPAKYDWQEKYRRPDDEGEDQTTRRWLPIDMIDPQSDAEGFPLKQLPKVRQVGEGKERDLNAARSCAVWPDATDDQLKAPKQVLTGLLDARLPGLLAEFEAAMRECGFLYPEAVASLSE